MVNGIAPEAFSSLGGLFLLQEEYISTAGLLEYEKVRTTITLAKAGVEALRFSDSGFAGIMQN